MYEAIELHIEGLIEDKQPVPRSTSFAEYVIVRAEGAVGNVGTTGNRIARLPRKRPIATELRARVVRPIRSARLRLPGHDDIANLRCLREDEGVRERPS